MIIKCRIEIEHNDDLDLELLADNLADFFENDEQTYCDKGEIGVFTFYSSAYRGVNNG